MKSNLKSALLSASLALFLPAAASASSLPPPIPGSPAVYSNTITLTKNSSQTVPQSRLAQEAEGAGGLIFPT